jgi:regulator of sigma E protease
LTSILAFLFVLGVLIFVHELGHFLMARRIGVRVITFSLGFGPKILSFKRGDTEYAVSAIPLGGYVKMAGENPEDSRTGASDEFLSKSKWQRFQVLIMGPVMNLILAFVVMAVVLYQGADVPKFEAEPPVIGSFDDKVTVARDAGLQVGDRILSVDGGRDRGRDVGTVVDAGPRQGQPPDHVRRRSRRPARRRRNGSRRIGEVRDRIHRRHTADAAANQQRHQR